MGDKRFYNEKTGKKFLTGLYAKTYPNLAVVTAPIVEDMSYDTVHKTITRVLKPSELDIAESQVLRLRNGLLENEVYTLREAEEMFISGENIVALLS